MAVNPEIVNALDRGVKMPVRVAAAQKKIDPVFKDLNVKVPAAIKDGDKEMLQYYLRAIRTELNSISAAMLDVTSGLNELKWVEEEDEDLLADHLTEVEKATKLLSDAQKDLTHQYETMKACENDAEQAVKSHKISKDDLFVEIAKYDKFITQDNKILADTVDGSMKLIAAADDAVENRNAKALAAAQDEIRGMGISSIVDGYQDRENELKALLKKIEDQKLDAKATAELKDGVNDLLVDRLGIVRPRIKGLQHTEEHILKLKVEPIKTKEAMDVMGLDPDSKVEARLTAVFKGRPEDFEKGLEKVAKDFKLKTNGKAMLAALKKSWSR